MGWFNTVTQNIAALPEFIEHYQQELNEAKYEVRIVKGERVERLLSMLPGITEQVGS